MHLHQFTLIFFFCISLNLSVVLAGLQRSDWSDLDLDLLDEQWSDGDLPEDLLSPSDILLEQTEIIKQQAMERFHKAASGDEKLFSEDELVKMAVDAENAGKPAMIFCELSKNNKWNKDSLDSICQQWMKTLPFGPLTASCYPNEPSSILVTVQKGWLAQEVHDYLARQIIIDEISWNDIITKPADILREEAEEDYV